jgi:hypothetical protein
MTQNDCLRLLERKKDKWFFTKEVSKILKISRGCGIDNLNKLFKQGYANRKVVMDHRHRAYKFKLKK